MEQEKILCAQRELAELLCAAEELELAACLPDDPALAIHCSGGLYTPRQLLRRAAQLARCLEPGAPPAA